MSDAAEGVQKFAGWLPMTAEVRAEIQSYRERGTMSDAGDTTKLDEAMDLVGEASAAWVEAFRVCEVAFAVAADALAEFVDRWIDE